MFFKYLIKNFDKSRYIVVIINFEKNNLVKSTFNKKIINNKLFSFFSLLVIY